MLPLAYTARSERGRSTFSEPALFALSAAIFVGVFWIVEIAAIELQLLTNSWIRPPVRPAVLVNRRIGVFLEIAVATGIAFVGFFVAYGVQVLAALLLGAAPRRRWWMVPALLGLLLFALRRLLELVAQRGWSSWVTQNAGMLQLVFVALGSFALIRIQLKSKRE